MIAFGRSPVTPIEASTTITIGAIARIGIVCEAMIQGIRLRSSVRECTIATAMSDAEQRAESEAEQRRGERHPAVIERLACVGLGKNGGLDRGPQPPDAARAASASAGSALQRRIRRRVRAARSRSRAKGH